MSVDVLHKTITTALATLADTQLQEVMAAICIDGISYAVMLVSPFDLKDFAHGFAISEVLVQHIDELRDIHISKHENSFTLDLALSPRAQRAMRERRRLMQGATGCGLCGADAITYALASTPSAFSASDGERTIPSGASIAAARLLLPSLQVLNRHAGGGMHAAALFNLQGNLTAVREDVGRHNALDKLIGATRGTDRTNSFAMLTSRCSYELVLKCARAGIGTLVTFAAPTTLAVQCAQRANITLACYQGPALQFYHLAGPTPNTASHDTVGYDTVAYDTVSTGTVRTNRESCQ